MRGCLQPPEDPLCGAMLMWADKGISRKTAVETLRIFTSHDIHKQSYDMARYVGTEEKAEISIEGDEN